MLPGDAGTVGAGEAPYSPPAATETDSCWSVSVCQLNMVPLPFLSPWTEVPMPRHFLLLAALMEFRVRRRWEVRHSSEEHKVVWKKSILLSYLKNIIKSWKKQQRGFLFCFFPPVLSKSGGLQASRYLGYRATRWAPTSKSIKQGFLKFMDSTSHHTLFFCCFCFCFALRKDSLTMIFHFLLHLYFTQVWKQFYKM